MHLKVIHEADQHRVAMQKHGANLHLVYAYTKPGRKYVEIDSPSSPVSPFLPLAPSGPLIPLSPGGPLRPISPISPLSPIKPG